jgi:DNA polymerase-4
VDADAFFAAVEQRDDPSLRGRPIVVGQGVVMAASYEARAFGVRGAMNGGRARALCPDLIAVKPRFDAYVAASRALMELFRAAAPVVEARSLEEAFLDLGPDGSPEVVGAALRRAARETVGLSVTVGAGSTRVVAKVASRKAKPDGLLVLDPEDELPFLHALAVDEPWGIGPATAAKLRAHELGTIGEVARMTERDLIAILGSAAGRFVHAVAHNRDMAPVRRNGASRSVGAQRALGRRGANAAELDETLVMLVERITGRMAKHHRSGRVVTLRLRFGDYERATRSRALGEATERAEPILAAARELLGAARPDIEARGITLLGVTVGELDCGDGSEQLSLGM